MTMSIGQWDNLLAAAYDNGFTLIEVDENELFVQCYKKPANP